MEGFVLGALALTLGGFLIMAISKSKAKPWIILDQEEQEEADVKKEEERLEEVLGQRSKFF